MLALANTNSVAEARRALDDIRYRDGTLPAYAHRDHVMEAQWIPDMIHKGYVREATKEVGGAAVREASITFTEASWARRKGLEPLPWADAPHGTFTLPYLPLDEALRTAETFPEGLLLNVVREPREGMPTIVSHTGMIVVKDGRRYLRHAMLANHMVTDEPILDFLKRNAAMREWKVVGVNLLRVQDDHLRLARNQIQ
jgi:hypothetical protein